jgi:hypothetical protein
MAMTASSAGSIEAGYELTAAEVLVDAFSSASVSAKHRGSAASRSAASPITVARHQKVRRCEGRVDEQADRDSFEETRVSAGNRSQRRRDVEQEEVDGNGELHLLPEPLTDRPEVAPSVVIAENEFHPRIGYRRRGC